MIRRRSALTVFFLLMLSPARAQDRKPVAIEDLYLFDGPRSTALAPDGKKLAYIRHWIDRSTKTDRYSLWLVEGNVKNRRPLEKSEPDARLAVFSPDGQWIAFLSTRSRPKGWKQTPPVPPESDAATDIWLIPAKGGVAIPLAGPDKPYGRVFNDGFYGRIAFSADATKLVFIADDGVDPRTKEEVDNDVIIVRPDQGEGYTGYGPAQIWVAQLDAQPGAFAAKRIDRLTDDDDWYGDPQWAPDGKHLIVHANKTADRESVRYSINKNFDLWSVSLELPHDQHPLTKGPGPEVSPRISPDGKRIVCLSVPRKGTHRDVFNLAVVSSAEGLKTTVLFDHHRPEGKLPHPPPAFPLPDDCWDGNDKLYYSTEAGLETHWVELNLPENSGKVVSAARGKAGPYPRHWLDRLAVRGALTPPGNVFLRDRTLGKTTKVTWKNEGYDLEGALTVPPGEVAKPPYKLILYPHGGPHSRSTLGFNFMAQVFAAHGYAVFQPNFRGSSGYTQKFIDADRADFGGGDMRDILSGIDHLIGEGLLDKNRQFVYGSSYGGFMTSWLVGHTDRFRAAVAQNAVTDLTMMWGLTDIQSWTQWEFRGFPWEQPELYRKHSPLTYVDKVKTPTLIVHCREDRRVPLPLGKAFYQALLSRGVPTQMVIYPHENHGIRQPRHQEDVWRRILGWFEKHGG